MSEARGRAADTPGASSLCSHGGRNCVFVVWLHHPVSSGETGCPFGSGRLFSACSGLSPVAVREGFTVLWGHGGRRTRPPRVGHLSSILADVWRLEQPSYSCSAVTAELPGQGGRWRLRPVPETHPRTPHTDGPAPGPGFS